MQALSVRVVVNYRPAFRYAAGSCRPVCHGCGLHEDPGRSNADYPPVDTFVRTYVFCKTFYVVQAGAVYKHTSVTVTFQCRRR